MPSDANSVPRGRASRRPPLPTIEACERAIGLPVLQWAGNCHSVATALVTHGLVTGSTRYGFYSGPVAATSYFSATAPFHRHGWIELPGGRRIVDPTRWAFEDVEPYIHLGSYAGDHYDPGMQGLKWARLREPPGRRPGDLTFELALSSAAADHLSAMLGDGRTLNFDQLFWVANLPIAMLGPHCREIYMEIRRLGQSALVPIDNFKMATDPGGPPPHLSRAARPTRGNRNGRS